MKTESSGIIYAALIGGKEAAQKCLEHAKKEGNWRDIGWYEQRIISIEKAIKIMEESDGQD